MRTIISIIFFLVFVTTSWSQDSISYYFNLSDTNVNLRIKSWTLLNISLPLARETSENEINEFCKVAKFIKTNSDFIYEIGYHTYTTQIPLPIDSLSSLGSKYAVNYLETNYQIDPSIIKPKSYAGREPFILPFDLVRLGYEFYKGTVLSDEYISTLKDKKEQRAAHSLNHRVVLKITGIKNK